MSRRRSPPQPRENPLHQRAEMARLFPGFSAAITRGGGLVWRGTLQPTSDSPEYLLRILHEPNHSPRTFVVHPKLPQGAPHTYRDGSLCLYWPNQWRWGPRESLAATIVPWAALWLYYYEAWLAIGEWLGPSSPHQSGAPKEAA